MKKLAVPFLIILSFFIMLLFPKEVFAGASKGLLLWFEIVLPTLLPFIIISNLLVYTNAITYIARILGPVLKRIFSISENGAFAVVTGFLCGYPMGAKTTADLIRTGYISKEEGAYLLSFCNNTSPMFIISYVIWQNLKREELAYISIFILFAAPVICSFFFRFYYLHIRKWEFGQTPVRSKPLKMEFSILDSCIMDGFETITKVGGYIILFSVLITLLGQIPVHSFFWDQIFLPMFEITNGIPLICAYGGSFAVCYILSLALTSFGGLCSIAQTKCMIQETGLSITPYIAEKLITAMVTSLLAAGYILFV